MKTQLAPCTSRRIAARIVPSLIAVLALSACGGDDDDVGAPPLATTPPVAVQPEPLRPQDGRTYAVIESNLPFAAMASAPQTDRWWGVLNKAGYQIEVPKTGMACWSCMPTAMAARVRRWKWRRQRSVVT